MIVRSILPWWAVFGKSLYCENVNTYVISADVTLKSLHHDQGSDGLQWICLMDLFRSWVIYFVPRALDTVSGCIEYRVRTVVV